MRAQLHVLHVPQLSLVVSNATMMDLFVPFVMLQITFNSAVVSVYVRPAFINIRRLSSVWLVQR
jgi:hypothetical protein